jgi:hypothetical protein
MKMTRDTFLAFSSEITGYSTYDLEGTGLVTLYHDLLENVLGPRLGGELEVLLCGLLAYPAGSSARQEAMVQSLGAPSLFAPVVSNLVLLWYLGSWEALPDTWYAAAGLPFPGPNDVGATRTPSAAAYANQLSWRTAFANAPGSNPPGFGSWCHPPLESSEVY